MKVLSKETEQLLDKLYNLRSDDSYVLAEMEEERKVAEETKEKTTKQKKELQNKIESLTKEESVLADQGAHLRDILSGINPDDFKMVLERLNIDFNPEEIKDKIDELLPGTIEEVVKETKEAEDELSNVEEEMNSAITKIDELAVRKETELANQDKLNEYFDLALNGNINITREAITSLISQFGFTEEEQREAAKLMMFPEDALYDYDQKYHENNVNGKSISDVLIEAKESVSKPIEEIFKGFNEEEKSEEPSGSDISDEINPSIINEEKNDDDSKSISDLLNSSNTEDFPFNEESSIFEPVNVSEFKTDEEEINNPVINDYEINAEDNVPQKVYGIRRPTDNYTNVVNNDADAKSDEESMMDLFKRLGLSDIMFVESELEELINLEDKKIVEKNVNILKDNNINLDIVSDNVNILSDPELKEKIDLIISEGKTGDDIYFNPSVLKKYDYKGLENAINLLKENGLDPKKVPLMAY